MAYKAVIFDFGRVLLNWEPKDIFIDNEFSSEAEFREFLNFIMPFHLCSDAGLAFDKIFPLVAQRFPEKKELIEKWEKNFERSLQSPIWEAVEILKELKEKTNLHLFGLTNFEENFCQKMMQKYDFFQLLDDVVISGEVGLVKPYEAIYKILPKRYSLKMKECIFIDDARMNVETANRLGIYGILFKDAQKLREELVSLNIL